MPVRPLALAVACLTLAAGVIAVADAGAAEEGAAPRVIGGKAAARGELPSLAFIYYILSGDKTVTDCTGTVVAPRLVLTAAHCVHPVSSHFEIERFRVIVGDVKLTGPDRRTLGVARAVRYPGYVRETGRGDVGLLELSEPAGVPAMLLASRRFWSPGDEGEVAGWGQVGLRQRDLTYLLHRATLTVTGRGECRATGGGTGQLCAIDAARAKATPCFGDSGGPLLMRRPGDRKLVEIAVVHGSDAPCNPSHPTIFTSTVPIAHWVRARVRESRERSAGGEAPQRLATAAD